jgi:hypothetical protein
MTDDNRPRRQLRNFLLDRGLQLRYTAFVVLLTGALTAGLGAFVMSKAHEATRVVDMRALDPSDPVAQQIAAHFAAADRALLIGLVVFGVALALLLTGYTIVMTHRVAGPLFKMQRTFEDLGSGIVPPTDSLRRHDELTDVYGSLRRACDVLRAHADEDLALIDRLLAVVKDDQLRAALESARARKLRNLSR